MFEKLINFFKNIEPFLRLIEVLIIGITGVIVAIEANSIANTANDIAEKQLELSQNQSQPTFKITEEKISNSEGEENSTSVINVEEVSGTAYNITIHTLTVATVVYAPTGSQSTETLYIEIEDYYNNNNLSDIGAGETAQLTNENNYKHMTDVLNDYYNNHTSNEDYRYYDLYFYTPLYISYEDISGQERTEYYVISDVFRNKVWHMDESDFQDVYVDIRNSSYSLTIDNLSFERIDSIVASTN